MKKTCTLCGCRHNGIFSYKGGYICEDCIQQLKIDSGLPAEAKNRY